VGKLRWGRFDNTLIDVADELDSKPKNKAKPSISIPWDVINAYYEAINMDISDFKRDIIDFMPIGWYSVGHSADSDSSRLFVWSNQYDGYMDMAQNLNELTKDDTSYDSVVSSFFNDINDPLPATEDINKLIEVVKQQGCMPPWFTFDERDKFDPETIAKRILEEDMGVNSKHEYLKKEYKNPYAGQLFTEYDDFRDRIQQIINGIFDRNGESQTRDEAETKPIQITPLSPISEDLDVLEKIKSIKQYQEGILYDMMEEISRNMFDGDCVLPESISWTDKPIKNCWGWFREGDRSIRINMILNNKQIPTDVIKYIIYHEMLHCKGLMKHNKEFRIEEHKYPRWQNIEHELAMIEEEYYLNVPNK
jgi:hypothetical protein